MGFTLKSSLISIRYLGHAKRRLLLHSAAAVVQRRRFSGLKAERRFNLGDFIFAACVGRCLV